jgi:hypothetical protein
VLTAWRVRLARWLPVAVLGPLARPWRAHRQTKWKRGIPLLQSSVNVPGKPAGGAEKTFACPHCGLKLTIVPDKLGTHLSFDFEEWKRRCRFPGMESPLLCLLGQGGALGPV